MRHVALLVAVLAGCGLTEPEITIRVQGTVTAATDGTAVQGARVEVWKMAFTPFLAEGASSDAAGHYSLSFVETGYCSERGFGIWATCGGFQTLSFAAAFDDTTYIGCTDEVQIIDFQLDLAWNDAWLLGVWGSSPADVYAVGSDGAIGHYDGTEWSGMTTGATEDHSVVCGTSEELLALWGTSSSDIYAVGAHGTILHYDGTEWGAGHVIGRCLRSGSPRHDPAL
jgi:hypothetical protein